MKILNDIKRKLLTDPCPLAAKKEKARHEFHGGLFL